MEFLVDPCTHVIFMKKHKRMEKMTIFQAVGVLFSKQKMKVIFLYQNEYKVT